MINFYSYHKEDLDLHDLYKTHLDATSEYEYSPAILHIIKQSPRVAYLYAISCNSRWKEAEHVIRRCPIVTYHYAKNVICGRWIEVESELMKCEDWWERYCMSFKL